MNVDTTSDDRRAVPAAFGTLARWYAEHAAVRRLLAISEPRGLRILVALEPTPDGSDFYPAWLANGHDWERDLQSRMSEPVQLEVTDEPFAAEVSAGIEGIVVAEFFWRDPSTLPDDWPHADA